MEIRYALFKNKLNWDQIANHIIEFIKVRLGVDMTLCRAVMFDRAATNTKVLRIIWEIYSDIKLYAGKNLGFV